MRCRRTSGVQPFRARRRDGQRKDGGVPAGHRGGRRERAPGARAHSRDRPHAAIARPLSARAVLPCGALHSGLSDGERLSAWTHARNGTADVVVGTRSAVFAPLARPGALHRRRGARSLFKQQDGFRYSARDLAVVRARDTGCRSFSQRDPVAGGARERTARSLPPSRAAASRRRRIAAAHRRRRSAVASVRQRFVRCAHRSGRAGEGPSEQALLFINRRGYAPLLVCHACGWIAECLRCDAHLVFHREDGRLRCHHCSAERC